MKKTVFFLVCIVLVLTGCQKIKNEVADFVEEADQAVATLNSKSNPTVKDVLSEEKYNDRKK